MGGMAWGVMPIMPVVMGFGRRAGEEKGRDRSHASVAKRARHPSCEINVTPRHERALFDCLNG